MAVDLPDDRQGLNQNHRRVLQSAFAHLDNLLGEIEAVLFNSGKVFPRYVADLSTAQQKVVLDYTAQIRSQIRTALHVLTIEIPAADINTSHAIQTALIMAQVTLQEIGPGYLRGYGELGSPDTVELLTTDLARTFRRVAGFLNRGPAADLESRVHRLETTSPELSVLTKLERIITQRGLVEFRGALQALLEQVESKAYEIAVFGRVSSGKSSLLNAVLGMNVLPVGVTPVTAVATRIVWGDETQLHVAYDTGDQETDSVMRIAEFVTEGGNPDNGKRVARVTVSLPAANLRSGIVLVDTPGVGSLASSGARETYAYLPRCDLGVLLIDASGAPSEEDLGILRLLNDSGIPALAVISKADLLSPTDLDSMNTYLHSSIHAQLGIDIPVHAVSSLDNSEHAARDWFARELASRCAQAEKLAAESARSKLSALRQNVLVALQSLLDSRKGQRAAGETREVPNFQLLAMEAEGVLHKVEESCTELADLSQYAGGMAVRAAVSSLIPKGRGLAADTQALAEILRRAISQTADYVRLPLRQDLLDARDRLRSTLGRMATPFPYIAVKAQEINVDLITLPIVEVSTRRLNIHLNWPLWLDWFHAMRVHQLTSQIEAAIRAELEAAFQLFGQALRIWSNQAISRLSEQFAAQAEPLRAHARRLLEFQQTNLDEQEVASDLADLAGSKDAATAEPES